MVEIETVLILGAGASKDFGFPIGKQLVRKICRLLTENKYWDIFYVTAGQYSTEMVIGFRNDLKEADPLSIDAWLEHNPKYINVGRVAIAMALLERESNSNLRPENNWYQLLLHRLDSPFDEFQNNKLSIITFNYDRSLEQYLFGTFRYTHAEKGKEDCKKKLNELRILHVYGSLGRLEWQFDDPKHPLPHVAYGAELQPIHIFSAGESIKIIPEKIPALTQEFQEARELISRAKALYFLGFGYNKTNMERLGLDILRKPNKIMGTGYGLGYQEIRELERLNIKSFGRSYALLDEPVYKFLHKYVDFNENSLPDVLKPQDIFWH